MSRATSATVGVIVGGLVGAAAALLFAPKRGEETRSDVMEWTRDRQHKAADAIRGAGSSVASGIRQVPQYVSEKAPDLVSAAAGMFRRSERAAEEVESTSERTAESIE